MPGDMEGLILWQWQSATPNLLGHVSANTSSSLLHNNYLQYWLDLIAQLQMLAGIFHKFFFQDSNTCGFSSECPGANICGMSRPALSVEFS